MTAAAKALRAVADRCPGRGLELSMVARRHALHPAAPWPFLLHVTTDPTGAKTVLGPQSAGDPDLVMHYAVCRASGIVVRGPAPAELIGVVARSDVFGYLEAELRWAGDNAPGHTGCSTRAGRWPAWTRARSCPRWTAHATPSNMAAHPD